MRITFDSFTFAIIGISVFSLSPALLQFHLASPGPGTFYPVRFNLSEVSSNQTVPENPGPHGHRRMATGSALSRAGSAAGTILIEPQVAGPMGTPAPAVTLRRSRPGGMQPQAVQSPGENYQARNFLAVKYDLGTATGTTSAMPVKSPGMLAGTIDIRKKIRVGETATTNIDVKLGSGANIYVNAAQLSSILEAQGKVLTAGSGAGLDGFVSLDDLRSKGFNVRYDAAGDALIVDGEA